MIVGNLDVPNVAIAPHEADAPLVIDTDAVLAPTIAVQSLQSIAWRDTKVVELRGGIDGQEFRPGARLNLRRKPTDGITGEDRRGPLVRKAPDHAEKRTVKRYVLSRFGRLASRRAVERKMSGEHFSRGQFAGVSLLKLA